MLTISVLLTSLLAGFLCASPRFLKAHKEALWVKAVSQLQISFYWRFTRAYISPQILKIFCMGLFTQRDAFWHLGECVFRGSSDERQKFPTHPLVDGLSIHILSMDVHGMVNGEAQQFSR